jgi:hypothetical protein
VSAHVFAIEEIVSVIKRAQRRADKLRVPQALVIRHSELAITPAKYADNPLEICWPKGVKREGVA